MTNQPEVRAIATQLIHNAIKSVDCETAADHITNTMGDDVDVDALAFGAEAAVQQAHVSLSWDGDAADADSSRLARLTQLIEDARDKGNTVIDTDILVDALDR
ncbi:hypothetical protein E2C11_16550 [Streptomyces lavendulae]|nr:hypothetical protein [Streptomyces lavendulae]TXJ78616.1 hypothetical protein E2C11_16550 [Streptomyces lavendulae]